MMMQHFFAWCNTHPDRTMSLVLPEISPSEYYGITWSAINNKVDKFLLDIQDELIEEEEEF